MEMSDHNLSVLIDVYFNKGDYKEYNFKELVKQFKIELNNRDIEVWITKLVGTGFIERKYLFSEDYVGHQGHLRLSHKGIVELSAHKTYIKYLEYQKKKAQKEKRNKNWNEFIKWAKENTGKAIVAGAGVAATFVIAKNCTPTPNPPPPTTQESPHIQEKKDSTAKSP